MPELRKDPVVGRWVIIATERGRRPGTILDQEKNIFEGCPDCQFCNNQDPEIFAIREHNSSSWRVKVVPSGTPVLGTNKKFMRRGYGVYDIVNGYGANEVVIETPQHIANMADLDIDQIKCVFQAYVSRFKDLERDTKLQYILAYKNYGWAAGSRRIGHARSQIIASPVNPLRIKEKLLGAKHHFEHRDRCIYCDLIYQELETKERVIMETEHFVSLTPFASRFPFEVLIMPKIHHCDFSQGALGYEEELARVMKDLLMRFKVGLEDPAYNYVIQTAPFRRGDKGPKWRTVEEDYHWHIEVMPRLARAAGFEKGTGFYICAIPPEQTAEFLREVNI